MSPEQIAKIVHLPFRPNTLAYKLNCLFNAGVITPETLAKSVAVPIYRVDRWARGTAEPDPVTRVQVDKVLSYYKRLSFRHLKLEDEASETAVDPPKVGVREDLEALPGAPVFNVYGASGQRLGFWTARPGVTDPELIEAFEGLIQRKDAPHIEAMPVSGEVAS